jgi:hypothetical protein
MVSNILAWAIVIWAYIVVVLLGINITIWLYYFLLKAFKRLSNPFF